MNAAPAPGATDRRMRRRRVAKIVLVVLFAVIWIPVALIMLMVSVASHRA